MLALPQTPGSDLARWEDALVGGATALLVAALLPADPWRVATRTGQAVRDELARVARCTARALRDGDEGQAAEALAAARATQGGLDDWAEALVTGRDITRLSPLRSDRGGTHAQQLRLQSGVDRANANLRVLVRRVVFALETGEPLPPLLADELDRFADAVQALEPGHTHGPPEALRRLAADLDPGALGVRGLSGGVAVAQLRSAVVDLLVAVGVPTADARSALPPLGP